MLEPGDVSRLSDDLSKVLETAFRAIAHNQRSLRDRVDGLEQRLSAAERAMARLDTRLSELLSERTRERDDLATADHARNYEIANRFQGFVDHRLQSVARERVQSHRRSKKEDVPQLIGQLCQALFKGEAVDAQQLYALLDVRPTEGRRDPVAELCIEAEAMRKDAAASGVSARWEFRFDPGSSINPSWQEPWGSCDPALPVRFVVTPAYMVQEQVFCRQRVSTGMASEGGWW